MLQPRQISSATGRRPAGFTVIQSKWITVCCWVHLLSLVQQLGLANLLQQQLNGRQPRYELVANENQRELLFPGNQLSAEDLQQLDLLLNQAGPQESSERPLWQAREEPKQLVGKRELIPGHYEFEVAPKMEPPVVRGPPFKQTNQVCPGTDLFAGFSPRDTLCGDLNQGKVPLNPLGQSVTEQAYPFELIKNKTLQFLARALPMLKLEYEVMPKVARYLPAHQLLNPTSLASPLGREHFQGLNRRLAPGDEWGAPQQAAFAGPQGARRKRSPGPSPVDRQASITVADLTPNASLVVHSAHSAALPAGQGRIRSAGASWALGESAALQPAMITKDGFRPIGQAAAGQWRRHTQSAASPSSSLSLNLNLSSTSSSRGAAQSVSRENNSSGQGNRGNGEEAAEPEERQERQGAQTRNGSVGGAGQTVVGGQMGKLPQIQERTNNLDDQDSLSRRAASSAARNHASKLQQQQPQIHQQQQQQIEHAETRDLSAPTSGQAAAETTTSSPAAKAAQQQGQQQESQIVTTSRRRSSPSCADVGGPILSTVCQTASALVEGEKAPTWVRLLREVGNMYAGSSGADLVPSQSSASGGQQGPVGQLWWLWSSLVGGGPQQQQQQSAGGPAPLEASPAAPETRAKSATQQAATSSPLQTMSNILGLIGPLASYLAPSLQRDSSAATSPSHAPSTGSGRGGGMQKRDDKQAQPAATHWAQSTTSTMGKISNVLLGTTALVGLVDYFAPSLLSSGVQPLVGSLLGPQWARSSSQPARRSTLDNLVDTPASLAALKQQQQQGSAAAASNQQPPTPCPSVEEYISPTFARNYQGAWKYVVQIPHEGYFTQTIQRSSCLKQRCQFTDGLCHEAPRWVSLLVAEIYYPNAIFGRPANGGQSPALQQQQQQQAAGSAGLKQLVASEHELAASGSLSMAASQQHAANQQQHQAAAPQLGPHVQAATPMGMMRHAQPQAAFQQQHQMAPAGSPSSSVGAPQDPMQMVDSFSTYNLNLNNLLASQAAGLLDPPAPPPRQEAGRAAGPQARMGQAGTHAAHWLPQTGPDAQSGHAGAGQQARAAWSQVAAEQQQQQQQLHNDYIKALAVETLRQNPHLSLEELIRSLQLQASAVRLERRRRDLRDQQHQAGGPSSAQRAHFYPSSGVSPSQQQQAAELLQQRLLADQQAAGSSLAESSGQPSGAATSPLPGGEPSGVQAQQMAADQAGQLAPTQLASQQAQSQQQQQQQSHQTQSHSQGQPQSQTQNQLECDGYDKIGCYVVRVYYDWFLVNGSCKCWKTSLPTGQPMAAQKSSSPSNSSPTGSGSFIRRIFTG